MDIYIPTSDESGDLEENPLNYAIKIPDDYASLDAKDLLIGPRHNRLFYLLTLYLLDRMVEGDSSTDLVNISRNIYKITKRHKFQNKDEEYYKFDNKQYKEALEHFLNKMDEAVFFADDVSEHDVVLFTRPTKKNKESKVDKYLINTDFTNATPLSISKRMDLMPFDGLTLKQLRTASENEIVGYVYETGTLTEEEREELKQRYKEGVPEEYQMDLDREPNELLAFFDEGNVLLDDNTLKDDDVMSIDLEGNTIKIQINTYEYYRQLFLKYKVMEMKPLSPSSQPVYFEVMESEKGKVGRKFKRRGFSFMGPKQGQDRNIPVSEMDKKPDKEKKERRETKGLPIVYEPTLVQIKEGKIKSGKRKGATKKIKTLIGNIQKLEDQDAFSLVYTSRIKAGTEKKDKVEIAAKISARGLLATTDEFGDLIQQELVLDNNTYKKDVKAKVKEYIKAVDTIKNTDNDKLRDIIIEDMQKAGKRKRTGPDLKGYEFDPRYFHYLTNFFVPDDKKLSLGYINIELDILETASDGRTDLSNANQITNVLTTGSGKAKVGGKRAFEEQERREDTDYWQEQAKVNSTLDGEGMPSNGDKYREVLHEDLLAHKIEEGTYPTKFLDYVLKNKEEYQFSIASLEDIHTVASLQDLLEDEFHTSKGKETEAQEAEEVEEGKEYIDEGSYESGEAEETESARRERLGDSPTNLTESEGEALSAGTETKTYHESTKYTRLLEAIIKKFREDHPSVNQKEVGKIQARDIKRTLQFITTGDAYYQHLATVDLAPEKRQRIRTAGGSAQPINPRTGGLQRKILSALQALKRTFLTLSRFIDSV